MTLDPTELAAAFAAVLVLGGIIVKATPTKKDDEWWQWFLRMIGKGGTGILLALLLAGYAPLGCTTIIGDFESNPTVTSECQESDATEVAAPDRWPDSVYFDPASGTFHGNALPVDMSGSPEDAATEDDEAQATPEPESESASSQVQVRLKGFAMALGDVPLAGKLSKQGGGTLGDFFKGLPIIGKFLVGLL